jgi:hypothetical protein
MTASTVQLIASFVADLCYAVVALILMREGVRMLCECHFYPGPIRETQQRAFLEISVGAILAVFAVVYGVFLLSGL